MGKNDCRRACLGTTRLAEEYQAHGDLVVSVLMRGLGGGVVGVVFGGPRVFWGVLGCFGGGWWGGGWFGGWVGFGWVVCVCSETTPFTFRRTNRRGHDSKQGSKERA